jgi:hypothetical protein
VLVRACAVRIVPQTSLLAFRNEGNATLLTAATRSMSIIAVAVPQVDLFGDLYSEWAPLSAASLATPTSTYQDAALGYVQFLCWASPSGCLYGNRTDASSWVLLDAAPVFGDAAVSDGVEYLDAIAVMDALYFSQGNFTGRAQ